MIAVYFLGLAALALVAGDYFNLIDGPQAGTLADLALWTVLLGVIAISLRRSFRGRLGDAATAAAAWLLLGGVLVTGYAYRAELAAVVNRVGGELVPGRGAVVAGGDYEVTRSRNGHYVVQALADEVRLRFLVDTGASFTTLSHASAARAGLAVAELDYSVPIQTANGMAFAARARLPWMTVGEIEVRDLDILVTQPGALNTNLLGLDFLDRLESYEVSGGRMTLRARG